MILDAPPEADYARFVRTVIRCVEAAGIDYMIGGAVAAWVWGEYRTTGDLDVVIDLQPEEMLAFSTALAEHGMRVPVDVMIDLLLNPRGDLAINAIQDSSGLKAEFFLLRPGDELRAQALARRILVDLGPSLGNAWVHSPEDLILYKLRYYHVSRQSKHVRDISSILQSVEEHLDGDYLNDWIARLGLDESWFELLDEVERLRSEQDSERE